MKPSYSSGIYSQVNHHFGLVENKEGEVFFIWKRERGNAFDGDEVKIKIIKKATGDKRAEAEVLQILKRTEKTLVGRFVKRPKTSFWFVQITEGYFGKDVFVADRDSHGAKNDDVVTVRVYGEKNKPYGKVSSILWNRNDPGIEEKIILFEGHIQETFPKNVLDQAEKLHKVTPETSDGKRKNLFDLCIVTIDGADARDLDDAISVKKFEDGFFELWVHIADVAEYVQENTPLDREAFKRGTSIYLPDRVIPMLPERLSNDLCSLNADTPKATLSIFMKIDQKGKVRESRIEETLIESKYRFTYDEVQALLDGFDNIKRYPELVSGSDDKKMEDSEINSEWRYLKKNYSPEILTLLRDALELKRILDIRRKQEGKIEFDFPEIKIIVDENGKVRDIKKRDRNEAHKVVEEFMILANEEISRFFSKRKIPFLYRVHEAPSEENLNELEALLQHFWYDVTKDDLTPVTIRNIMDTLHEKEHRHVLSKHILTSMSKALYSEESLGHFGLGLDYYSHFTSPIRRYPDLQIHRIIKAFLRKDLDKKAQEHFRRELPHVARLTSTSERKAEDIEYKIRDIRIIEYMLDHVGKIFDGTISSLTENGIYVELENGVEWLVYIRDLKSIYRLDERSGTLKSLSEKESYRLGQEVRIRVAKADKSLRRLDFELVQ